MYNPHLDTFLIVANTGSFSKAAEYLYVTPSAVIQQINALENRLKVPLFHRSNKGVSLTRHGNYLRSECVEYIRKGKDIQERLLAMPDSEFSLILGTSLREKCRVFYDFWVQFTDQSGIYTVQMQTVDTDFPLPPEIDLIEAAATGAQWEKQWMFLKLCQVPYGIAAARDHPLYGKESLRYEDLKDYSVILQRAGRERTDLTEIREDLQRHGIRTIERNGFGSDVVWDASINKQLIVIPRCFQDVIFDMNIKSMDWPYTIPYGFFCRPEASGLPARFIEYVKACHQKHPEIAGRLAG